MLLKRKSRGFAKRLAADLMVMIVSIPEIPLQEDESGVDDRWWLTYVTTMTRVSLLGAYDTNSSVQV